VQKAILHINYSFQIAETVATLTRVQNGGHRIITEDKSERAILIIFSIRAGSGLSLAIMSSYVPVAGLKTIHLLRSRKVIS